MGDPGLSDIVLVGCSRPLLPSFPRARKVREGDSANMVESTLKDGGWPVVWGNMYT